MTNDEWRRGAEGPFVIIHLSFFICHYHRRNEFRAPWGIANA
jgi:hypothetical protein